MCLLPQSKTIVHNAAVSGQGRTRYRQARRRLAARAKPRKKWRRRASRVVTRTFMQHHPPGMFTELCRLGFQFIPDRCCSDVSTPSHVCHGVAFP